MRAEGNERRPLRVIVSGGIGGGKSTVVQMMGDLGAVVVHADRIGHEVLEPDGPAYAAVADRWPMVLVENRVDRAKLAAIVFSDGEQLELLESLTHPHIKAEILRRVSQAGDQDVVVEIPLTSDLVGGDWTRILVDATDELRLTRAVARGMDPSDVANRMASQADRSEWLEDASFVIENMGTLEDLSAAVADLWAYLRAVSTA